MAEPLYAIGWGNPRGFTDALLEAVDEGLIDRDMLLQSLLAWMSESEVEDFCERNLMLRDEDNEPVIRRVED